VRQILYAACVWREPAREALARHCRDAGHFGFEVFDLQRKCRPCEAQLYGLALPCLKQVVPVRVLSDRVANFTLELSVLVPLFEWSKPSDFGYTWERGPLLSKKRGGVFLMPRGICNVCLD
jgi:hypothetical protein